MIGSSNNHDQDFTCNKSIDIVIIIDSSGSAQKHWNDTIDNSEIFQSYFNISDKMIRVGIVDSSAVSNVYKHLDSNNSNEEAYQLLESLRTSPQNGKTSIGTGLQMAMKLFESASPIRTESKKVILIFTDKQFSKYDKTTDVSLFYNWTPTSSPRLFNTTGEHYWYKVEHVLAENHTFSTANRCSRELVSRYL